MADNKDDRGARDRATVSGDEPYELDYFATKNDLSRDEAQALIDRVGNSRQALDAAVANRSKNARETERSPATHSEGPARTATIRAKSPASSPKRTSANKSPKSRSKSATGASGNVRKNAAPAPRRTGPVNRRRATSARKASAAPPEATAKRPGATGAKSAVTGRMVSIVAVAVAGLAAGIAANFGRKAIVQAPSVLAGDWFDALKAEHRLALALFDKLQETGSQDTGRRTVLLTQLKHVLAKHAFTEENVIYPALRTSGDKEHADGLNHDHGYVKQNLYDLEEMDKASPVFLGKIASFRTELEEHIREEENLIFPTLHTALGENGNAKLTVQANKEGFKLA